MSHIQVPVLALKKIHTVLKIGRIPWSRQMSMLMMVNWAKG